jgi:hypothetical protein
MQDDLERAKNRSWRYLTAHEARTIAVLADLIVPPDEEFGGGAAGGAVEFIDLVASSDEGLKNIVSGGLIWLDTSIVGLQGQRFVDAPVQEQMALLDRLAASVASGQESPGTRFFSLIRQTVVQAFFSSAEGIRYLGYQGNARLESFPGCGSDLVHKLLVASGLAKDGRRR